MQHGESETMQRFGTGLVLLVLLGSAALAGYDCVWAGTDEDAMVLGGPPKDKSAKEPSKPNEPSEPLKLPPGTIIVISPNARDALQKAEGVLLSREEYTKLIAAVEAARKQPAEKALVPTECRLNARVEQRAAQSVVRVQAVFDYRVERTPAIITLGCGKARAISASLDDGRLPILLGDEANGLSVLAEKPGPHRLTLELELPLVNRTTGGNERGFELDLPGAPITTLTFDPPAGVTKLRLNKRDTVPVSRFQPGESGGALGMIKLLDLSWEGQAPQAQPEPFAQAKLDLRVNIAADETTTIHGYLTLEIQQGKRKTWEVYLPPGMRIESVTGLPDPSGVARFLDQLPEVTEPSKADQPWLIKLREASAEPLRVGIARTIQSKWVPIGPIWVKQTAQQQGTITVSAVPELRVLYQPRADLRRTDADLEEGTRTTFTYTATEPISRSIPLEFTLERAQGGIQLRQSHELRLTELGWRISSKWLVMPSRVEVDSLHLEVPRGLREVQAGPLELLDGPAVRLGEVDGQWEHWRLKLATPKRNKAFSLELTGLWPCDPNSGRSQVLLPQPRQTKSNNIETLLIAAAPLRFELRGALREWENDRISNWESSLEPVEPPSKSLVQLQASTRRSPACVDLTWKVRPSTLSVRSTLNLTLGPTQAVVRQRLAWKDHAGTRTLRLRGPESLASWLRVVEGGTLEYFGSGQWQLTATGEADPANEAVATVAYAFALQSEPSLPLSVPLVWPESTSNCQTRVNVWNHSTRAGPIECIAGPWEQLPILPVAENQCLPALSLAATGTGIPLTLSRLDAANLALTRALLERGLAQAALADAGLEIYRVRYALRPTSAMPLEFDLPAALASLNLQVWVDGKRLTGLQPLAEPGEVGRTVIVPIDPERDRLSIVEFRYQLAGPALGRITFALPKPRHVAVTGPVRWQIGLPAGLVPLSFSQQLIWEDRLRWRRLPELTGAHSSVELERWFVQGLQPGSEPTGEPMVSDCMLSGRTLSLDDVTLVLVSRVAWLPAITLASVVLGVLLTIGLRRRPLLTVSLATPMMVAGGVVGVAWPQPMRQVLVAALPGLVLLGLMGLLLLLPTWRQRRRRKLPGFARVSGSSSLALTGSARAVQRELTTTSENPAVQPRSAAEGNP
jgi:hypothetical protein